VAATNHSTAGTGHPDSVTRYNLLVERLEEAARAGGGSKALSTVEAVRLLDQVAQPREPSLPVATLQTALFLPSSGDLYLSATSVPSTRGPFTHLTLDQLFSSKEILGQALAARRIPSCESSSQGRQVLIFTGWRIEGVRPGP